MAETVYLLLGSNLGDRERNLHLALEHIKGLEGLEVTAASGVYVSPAAEMSGEHPPFLNQVVKGDFQYTPNELLSGMEKIEQHLGRPPEQKGQKKDRSIDIDILLFGALKLHTERLDIPHPRLTERPFALVPLLEIDPQFVHPITRKPLSAYLRDDDRAQVILYKDNVARNI